MTDCPAPSPGPVSHNKIITSHYIHTYGTSLFREQEQGIEERVESRWSRNDGRKWTERKVQWRHSLGKETEAGWTRDRKRWMGEVYKQWRLHFLYSLWLFLWSFSPLGCCVGKKPLLWQIIAVFFKDFLLTLCLSEIVFTFSSCLWSVHSLEQFCHVDLFFTSTLMLLLQWELKDQTALKNLLNVHRWKQKELLDCCGFTFTFKV